MILLTLDKKGFLFYVGLSIVNLVIEGWYFYPLCLVG